MQPTPELISTYMAAAILGQSQRTVLRLIERGMLAAAPNPKGGRKLWVEKAQVEKLKVMIVNEAHRRQRVAAQHSGLKQMYLEFITRSDR